MDFVIVSIIDRIVFLSIASTVAKNLDTLDKLSNNKNLSPLPAEKIFHRQNRKSNKNSPLNSALILQNLTAINAFNAKRCGRFAVKKVFFTAFHR